MNMPGVREDALDDVSSKVWDVLVVGAGPAGALAAVNLARLGHAVLLVDAKEFPRDKVCGGCLNSRGQALLSHCGLAETLERCGRTPVQFLRMAYGRRRAEWPLTGMVAVNRSQFDAVLVEEAVTSGARFCSRTFARVLDDGDDGDDRMRMVQLNRGADSAVASAKVVLAADGLARSSLRLLPGFSSRINRRSRIGLGAVVEDPGQAYPRGRLTMAVSRHGYVGVTGTADGRLNIGAAVDADSLTEAAPADVIRDILSSCGLSVPESVSQGNWCGTPALTRQGTRFAARRLFVLGDAIGYVEPFSGEGMSWAMLTSILSIPFAQAAVAGWKDWLAVDWERSLQRKVLRESWSCRQLSRLVRIPSLAVLSMWACRKMPGLPGGLAKRIGDRPIHGLPPIVPGSCCPVSGPHYRRTGSLSRMLRHERLTGSTEPTRGH